MPSIKKSKKNSCNTCKWLKFVCLILLPDKPDDLYLLLCSGMLISRNWIISQQSVYIHQMHTGTYSFALFSQFAFRDQSLLMPGRGLKDIFIDNKTFS